MTITVAIKCSDGIVIACDSMLSIGSAQHQGQKLHVIPAPSGQLFAFAGDLGLAERFKAIAVLSAPLLQNTDKFTYIMGISNAVAQNFNTTGIAPLNGELCTLLAFEKDDQTEVCLFGHGTQPRLLDHNHYSCAIGSGGVAANPFLKFLEETLFENRQPTIAEGRLLAFWVIHYTIQTMSGGVGEPIDMATIQRNSQGVWEPHELTQNDILEIRQAMQSGCEALRTWKTALGSEGAAGAEDIPEPPAAPLPTQEVA